MILHKPTLEHPQFWRESPRNGIAELDEPPESLIVTGSAVAAGIATRKCLISVWKKLRGSDPPLNPAAPGVQWSDALIWAVAVGAAVGVARVLSRRGMTAVARKYHA